MCNTVSPRAGEGWGAEQEAEVVWGGGVHPHSMEWRGMLCRKSVLNMHFDVD
jgi:hypothetical protein